MMKKLFPLLAVVLTGCTASDFADPPPQFYDLRPPALVAAPVASEAQLLIDLPLAPAAIDTPRIAVVESHGRIGYFSDVTWVDRAPGMLQTLILGAFEASGRLPAVGRDNTGLRADYVLLTELRHLQAEEGQVRFEVQAKLVAMPRRNIIGSQAFGVIEPVPDRDIDAVVAGFQKASDQLMPQIVDWTIKLILPPVNHSAAGTAVNKK